MAETVLTDTTPAAAPIATPVAGVPAGAGASAGTTPSPDAKPEDAKAAPEGSKDAKGDKDKVGAPEKYEFKAPEGVKLDEAVLGEFTPLAKEMGLTQENAQKLVDLYAKVQAANSEASTKAWADLQAEWTNKTKTDKEFGGEKLMENVSIAKKAIEAFGTPELSEALTVTGVGNHPEFVRFFYKVGKEIGNDKLSFGKAGGQAPDPAKILFPNQK